MSWSLSYLRRMSGYVTFLSALRMRGMILRAAGKRSARPGQIQIRVKRPFSGEVWLREPGSDLTTFQEIAVHQIYRGAADSVRDVQYVFDIGGNIGLTSRYFAGRFPGCKIVTVEPSEENFGVLRQNLATLIAEGRCQPIRGAVWNEDGTVGVGDTPAGGGYHSIQVKPVPESAGDETVPSYTVDTLLTMSGFTHVDILKIDIEGSESTLFHGRTDWLRRVRLITIEFHDNTRRDSGFDETVKRYGFDVWDDASPNTVLAFNKQFAPASPA
jgi:FkbM family methyltransferase